MRSNEGWVDDATRYEKYHSIMCSRRAHTQLKQHVENLKALGDPRARTLTTYTEFAVREAILNDIISIYGELREVDP